MSLFFHKNYHINICDDPFYAVGLLHPGISYIVDINLKHSQNIIVENALCPHDVDFNSYHDTANLTETAIYKQNC